MSGWDEVEMSVGQSGSQGEAVTSVCSLGKIDNEDFLDLTRSNGQKVELPV